MVENKEIKAEMEGLIEQMGLTIEEMEMKLNEMMEEKGLPELPAWMVLKSSPKFRSAMSASRGTFRCLPFYIGEKRSQQIDVRDDNYQPTGEKRTAEIVNVGMFLFLNPAVSLTDDEQEFVTLEMGLWDDDVSKADALELDRVYGFDGTYREDRGRVSIAPNSSFQPLPEETITSLDVVQEVKKGSAVVPLSKIHDHAYKSRWISGYVGEILKKKSTGESYGVHLVDMDSPAILTYCEYTSEDMLGKRALVYGYIKKGEKGIQISGKGLWLI